MFLLRGVNSLTSQWCHQLGLVVSHKSGIRIQMKFGENFDVRFLD